MMHAQDYQTSENPKEPFLPRYIHTYKLFSAFMFKTTPYLRLLNSVRVWQLYFQIVDTNYKLLIIPIVKNIIFFLLKMHSTSTILATAACCKCGI